MASQLSGIRPPCAGVILAIVIANAATGFIQDGKAEKSHGPFRHRRRYAESFADTHSILLLQRNCRRKRARPDGKGLAGLRSDGISPHEGQTLRLDPSSAWRHLSTHARTHPRPHARTHARTHSRAHARAHALVVGHRLHHFLHERHVTTRHVLAHLHLI